MNQESIECPNATLHKSIIEKMNNVRREFWINIYNNPENICNLKQILQNNFLDCVISPNIRLMEILIKPNKIYSNSEIECKMWASMINFINSLRYKIPEEMYNTCIINPSLLYNITLNREEIIMIRL